VKTSLRSYQLAIPVFGVPVKGKRNPYLVLVSSDALIDVDVEVDEASRPKIVVEGEPPPTWRLRIPLSSFIDVLSDRLEQPVEAHVSYRSKLPGVPSSSLYAVITLDLVISVAEAGGYSLAPDEVVRAANSIDDDAGVGLDYVKAVREALLRSKSIVYREGDSPIEIDVRARLELVGEEDVTTDAADTLGEQTVNAITRLAGISVVESVAELREGVDFTTVFTRQARIDNAIYYVLYGLTPPDSGCKWTPSLSAGFAVCVAGASRGDEVEFA
jgi:hypothetical protein